MRKLILAATTVAALAVPTIAPAIASASVERYQTQTATFTVTQPAGQVGQWDNVWTHNYKVTLNPCGANDGTFSGTGSVSGHDQNGSFSDTEKVTGKFSNGSVSLTATRDSDGLAYTLTNASTGDLGLNAPITIATLNVNVPWAIEMKVSAPHFTSSNYKNHGDYVSSQGDRDDAAHSCIGMPIH